MRILTSAKYALGVTAAVAVLAACSGGGTGSQMAPSSPMTGNAVTGGMHANGHGTKSYAVTMKAVPHGIIKHYKQWMEKNANKNRLIYVSDFNNSIVQVYNYPSNGTQNPPAGTLSTGLFNPQGMCVNNNMVFIANTGDNNVVGYNYGDTSPSVTLANPGEYPVGCSVDSGTGDVAASDIFSPTTGLGAVTIWSGGSGTGTVYVEPGGLTECFFISYDGSGNLYVDGFNSFGFGMAYLPAGSSTWQAATLSGATINFPGGINWDGTNLYVEDQSGSPGYPTMYRCTPSGASISCDGTFVGLQGALDVTQPYIKRGMKGVVGADASAGAVYTWAFPAGGTPRPNKTIIVTESYPSLNGAAVQLGPN